MSYNKSFLLLLGCIFSLWTQPSIFAQTPEELGYVEAPIPVAVSCMNVIINHEVGSLSGTGSNSTATSAFPATSSLVGENILVKGTFILDKTMAFSNCKVFFASGANMVTSGAVNLIGKESDFTPCGNSTWEGITINANAAIQLQECKIDGAIAGLIFKAGYRSAQSHLIANQFYRNGNGILCTDAGATLKFTSFNKNYFTGGGTLPGTFILPNAGIKVANGNAFIGTVFTYDPNDPSLGLYGLYNNVFQNFRYGIEATNNKVVVQNCGFYQMRPSPDANGVPTGCGIRADGCNLYTLAGSFGGSSIGYCEFEYCAFAGINATNSETHISLAQFRGTQLFGITSTKTQNRFQRISRCQLTLKDATNKAGIAVERPGNIGTPSVWITLNTIDIINPGVNAKLAGIEVRSPNVSTGNLARIDNNQISLLGNTSVSYGIIAYGNATNNFRINNNHCNASDASISNFGIFLSDGSGTGHQVNNNHSTGDYTCNFHIQKFRNVGYCDNTCAGASNGFHFQGDNVGSVWSANHIGHHDVGLNIEDIPGSGGKIGPQVRKGNMWEEDDNLYSAFAAKCDGDFTQSIFKIEEDNNKIIFPTKTDPASGWFDDESGPLAYCIPSTDVLVSNFDYKYAAGLLPPGYLSASEGWEISRGLIKTLIQYPAAMAGNSILQYYYNQNLNSSAGKFAQAEALLESIPYLSATQQTYLDGLLSQQETLANELTALMQSDSKPNIDNGFYSTTNPIIETKVQQWISVSVDMAAILDQAMPGFQAHLGNVLTALQNITVNQPYEQAWKIIKLREIRDMMGITPTTTESAEMTNLAYASQNTYGAAVRHAWQYMPPSERFTLVSPMENTGARGENREVTASLISSDWLRIQPNPASDVVSISLSKPMNGHWSLINSTGNIVRNGIWQETESSMTLETSALPTGIYFFIFRPEQGRSVVQKLVISK